MLPRKRVYDKAYRSMRPRLRLEQPVEGMAQQTRAVQLKVIALLGLAQGFEEGGAVGVVAQHGLVVVAPVPWVVDAPIGPESRLASHQPRRRASVHYASRKKNGP